MILDGLQILLKAESTITDIVGAAGVYILAAPQGTDRPYLVLDSDEEDQYEILGDFTSEASNEVTFEAWASTSLAADQLSDAVWNYLKNYTGAAGNQTVTAIGWIGRLREKVEPEGGRGRPDYITELRLFIQHR